MSGNRLHWGTQEVCVVNFPSLALSWYPGTGEHWNWEGGPAAGGGVVLITSLGRRKCVTAAVLISLVVDIESVLVQSRTAHGEQHAISQHFTAHRTWMNSIATVKRPTLPKKVKIVNKAQVLSTGRGRQPRV